MLKVNNRPRYALHSAKEPARDHVVDRRTVDADMKDNDVAHRRHVDQSGCFIPWNGAVTQDVCQYFFSRARLEDSPH